MVSVIYQRNWKLTPPNQTLGLGVYSSFTPNCQDLEAMMMALHGWTEKQTTTRTNNGLSEGLRNDLRGHEETGRNLKCILLNKNIQSERQYTKNTMACMAFWTQLQRQLRHRWLQGLRDRAEKGHHWALSEQRNYPAWRHDATMPSYILQACLMATTRTEHSCEPWVASVCVKCISYNKCRWLRNYTWGGGRVYWRHLYFNLLWTLKNKKQFLNICCL